MKIVHYDDTDEIVAALAQGRVVVLATDTVYGIVAKASDRLAVERVYFAKKRTRSKSCIVLIDSIERAYGADKQKIAELQRVLPPDVPTSYVVDDSDAPERIRHGDGSLAYRVPNHPQLLKVLEQTGPIIAPSANPEGGAPAKTVEEAYDYFGEDVSLYVDSGVVDTTKIKPSRIVRVVDGKPIFLRD